MRNYYFFFKPQRTERKAALWLQWLACTLNPRHSINHGFNSRHPFPAAVRARFWYSAATRRSTWIGWRSKVARRDCSFPRLSPVSGARGAARTHTASHTPHARVKGATGRRSPDDFWFWCGTKRSMNLPSRHRSASVDKPSERLRGGANGDRF